MKKRVFSLFLSMILCLGLSLPAFADGGVYTDVPAGHWAADSIRRATELGLFQGVGGGKFGRGQPMSRAAFVTTLVRLFSWEPVSAESSAFTDVSPDKWYYSAVETAAAHGAFAISDHRFRPEDNITREDMAVMLVRGLGYAPLAGLVSQQSSPFTDVTVNRGFITVAYDLGIVSGVGDGLFAPNSSASREQAAAMLVRVYDKLHASSYQIFQTAGPVISVPVPEAKDGDDIPITPLEPLAELYETLRKARSGGMDMASATLQLTAGGVCTLTSGKRPLSTEVFTPEQVAEVLENPSARTYYSDRYESAYCIYKPNGYQSATLWYQSPESQGAKLKLARLFGVTQYMLV